MGLVSQTWGYVLGHSAYSCFLNRVQLHVTWMKCRMAWHGWAEYVYSLWSTSTIYMDIVKGIC